MKLKEFGPRGVDAVDGLGLFKPSETECKSEKDQRISDKISLPPWLSLAVNTATETETDSHTEYSTKQVFPLVRRQIPIPLLKYSKIGPEISP